MATTVAVATPETVGAEIRNAFSKLGKEIGVIGTDALKDLGIISKEISVYEPLVASTIEALFPGTKLTVTSVQKIINASVASAQAVAQALQAEGLNPTLNQVAAIAVATQVHVSGATAAQITSAVTAGTAVVDQASGVTPTAS